MEEQEDGPAVIQTYFGMSTSVAVSPIPLDRPDEKRDHTQPVGPDNAATRRVWPPTLAIRRIGNEIIFGVF